MNLTRGRLLSAPPPVEEPYPQSRVQHSDNRCSYYDCGMDAAPEKRPILCNTCERYRLETFRVGRKWQEARRCIEGMRFAGERMECSRYMREIGSDDN